MKKTMAMILAAALVLSAFVGCANAADTIHVVSREDGSGTRGAFIELFGIEQKNEAGEKVDYTTDMAEITNSTSVMLTTVAGDENAIGYVSMGSLNDTVKAVTIDGVEATVENVKNGTYAVSRPFNIATKGAATGAAADFIDFILSAQGAAIIEEEGYIAVEKGENYTSSNASGTITVSGSSSVTPVMEALKEAYEALNPNVTIELQQSDSTTGMNDAAEGLSDIGMASRELKEEELAAGLVPTVIAMDGIAVIVNTQNPVDDLTQEQVRGIYMGQVTDWNAL